MLSILTADMKHIFSIIFHAKFRSCYGLLVNSTVRGPGEQRAHKGLRAVMFSSSGKAQAPFPGIPNGLTWKKLLRSASRMRVPSGMTATCLFFKKVYVYTISASQLSRSICHHFFDWGPFILPSLHFSHLNSLACV